MPQLTIQQAFDLAMKHHQAGRLQEAEQIYRQILAQQPEHASAMHNLGMIARQAGRHDLAVDLIRRAIVLRPDYAEAYINLGMVLKDQGQLEEAIAAYRQAISLKPEFPEAYNNLGNALKDTGQFDAAIAAFRQAIALSPNYAETHSNLGIALAGKCQFDEAIAAFRQAIALKPNYAEAYGNLGNALGSKELYDEAIAAYRQATALKPDFSDAYSNLSAVLTDTGQLEEAAAVARQAIALRPNFPEAHLNLAGALLPRGDLQEGWVEYEWRLKKRALPWLNRGFSQPLWDGGDLQGCTILLHAEQGAGDTIQFIRYLPLVVARGGEVLVEVPPELFRLLRQLPGAQGWIARGEALPAFDVHCPLPSLPHRFQTSLQNIPPIKDVLLGDPELARAWRRRLEQQPPGLKIAVVWAGNPQHKNDRHRSLALSLLGPLAAVQGIQFYSLQKGDAAGQAAHPPAGMRIIDWTEELHDFADTAALVANLDLVISVDTSVAHLAGAMGKPVWLLLPFIADWRWLQNREDSPWYPTMRLFRQSSLGDWPGVIRRVGEALAVLAAEKPA